MKARKSLLTPMLVLLSIHCAVLVIFRMYYTGNHNYGFLLWNLFLAWIPFWMGGLVLAMRKQGMPHWFVLLPVGVWLLFLPNAPYILTDLFHLHGHAGVPVWFDLLMIVSTGWTGLLLGLISMINIHRWLREIVPGFVSWFLMTGTAFAAGFGVYLGRYVRWNSWDILAQPKPLLRDIIHRLLDPFEHPALVGVTMILGFLLMGVYATFWLFAHSGEMPAENQEAL